MVRVLAAPFSLTVTPVSVGSGPEERGGLVDERRRDLGALEQGGPRARRMPGDQPVEVVARDGVAVVGEVRVLRPAHVDGAAEAEGA